MTHGGFLVIHAANEKKNKLQEEEEMTGYSTEDLEGDWEFKFVRSVSGDFKKPEVLAFVVEEEALAGWRLVEKFDNNRIRFKRPASAKRNDATLPEYIDPYRTQHGISEAGLAGRILFVVFGAIALILLIANYYGAL